LGKKHKPAQRRIYGKPLHNVYSTTDPNLPKSLWTKLNKEPIVEDGFTAKGLKGGVTYYYYVTSFYRGGPESEPSDVVSAVARGEDDPDPNQNPEPVEEGRNLVEESNKPAESLNSDAEIINIDAESIN
jgi:hypothetical protein